MNYEKEIIQREKLLSLVRKGEEITSDDRLWLVTHPIYNRNLGYPYLNTDIIQLTPRIKYNIFLKVESLAYPERIIPIVAVPGGKGKIIANNVYRETQNGNVITKKPIKMFGALLDLSHRETKFVYQSDLGLLGVSFQCEYFDDKMNLRIRKSSDTGDPRFAMLREMVAKNKMLYRCKAPNDDNFESLVFSVAWEYSAER